MYSNYPQYAVAYPQYFGSVIPPEPEPDPGDAFTYTEDASGNLIITGLSDYGKTIENIVIPASYNGKKITEIKQQSFLGAQTIKTVHFNEGSSMLVIGTDAFRGASIENFDLPDSEVSIGARAFFYCACDNLVVPKNLKNISSTQVFNAVKHVTFEDGSTRVPSYIMYGNDALESFTIPDTVTTIGMHAFDGTKMHIQSLTLPANIERLALAAFQTVEIDHLTVPASLTNVSDTVVFGSVKHVTFEDGSTRVPSYIMYGNDALESFTIPDTVTTIGMHAFDGTKMHIQSLTLPANIERLALAAFQTVEIDHLTVPASLTNVSDTVVFGSVKHVTFEDGITKIPANIMLESSSAKSHYLVWAQIPASVAFIGNNAFGNCSSYTDTYFMGTSEEWASITIGTGNDYLKNAAVHFGTIPGVDD